MKRIMLVLSLMAIMLVAFSAPVLADEDWWGLDDVTDVDWEYWPGYGYYPEEIEWVEDGYEYEVELAPCGDDLCIADWDRDLV